MMMTKIKMRKVMMNFKKKLDNLIIKKYQLMMLNYLMLISYGRNWLSSCLGKTLKSTNSCDKNSGR